MTWYAYTLWKDFHPPIKLINIAFSFSLGSKVCILKIDIIIKKYYTVDLPKICFFKKKHLTNYEPFRNSEK